MYDSRAYYPSYYRSSHQNYAAPRRSAFHQQSHVKDRFNKKELVRSSRKKKEVVKQVYRVKRDGRKDVVLDSTPNNKKPAESMLATKGREVKRVTFKDPIVESERAKPKVSKVKKDLPLCKTKSQPGCPLGLTSWQERKLKWLSAEKLKSKNMAWVPKRGPQGEEDVQVHVARIVRGFGQHIVHIIQLCHLCLCHVAYPQV
jgi:hypothetical protein